MLKTWVCGWWEAGSWDVERRWAIESFRHVVVSSIESWNDSPRWRIYYPYLKKIYDNDYKVYKID